MTDTAALPQKRHFLILERIKYGHTHIDFACAETLFDALKQYIAAENRSITFSEDGSLSFECEGQGFSYPHLIAYIEAMKKQYHEWQIRELPEWILNAPFADGVCGDDWSSLDAYGDECRPYFQKQFPRSQAKWFLWRLKKDKALVTFYRREGYFQINVLARFTYYWDGKHLTIEPYTGTYDDILNSLNLDPGGRPKGLTSA